MSAMSEPLRFHYDVNGKDFTSAGKASVDVKKNLRLLGLSPEIVRRAAEWGADLLIVHEPTYYNHMDVHSDEALECEKRALIEKSGLTIYRHHDHAHRTQPDTIVAGEMKYMKLDARIDEIDGFDCVRLTLNQPMTPRALAAHIERETGIAHIRVCGAADVPCTRVTGMFGTPGGVFEELKSEDSEIVMTGEACEWMLGEYARDAAQLGHKKALLILGHIGSERDGMRYLADELKKAHPEIPCAYFECGEVYTYTDR